MIFSLFYLTHIWCNNMKFWGSNLSRVCRDEIIVGSESGPLRLWAGYAHNKTVVVSWYWRPSVSAGFLFAVTLLCHTFVIRGIFPRLSKFFSHKVTQNSGNLGFLGIRGFGVWYILSTEFPQITRATGYILNIIQDRNVHNLLKFISSDLTLWCRNERERERMCVCVRERVCVCLGERERKNATQNCSRFFFDVCVRMRMPSKTREC